MAFYLVTAAPRADRLKSLEERLARDEIRPMRPFGTTLTASLRNARRMVDGTAIWEEEDYCHPPLAQERTAVLDNYFSDITVETVEEGAGWRRIVPLPLLFPKLKASTDRQIS